MTLVAAIAALAAATCVGYYWGRRVGATPSTWKKRTGRLAVGKSAIGLLALLIARRIRRRFGTGPIFTEAVLLWGLRLVAPGELLRGSLARMRI
jgi:hypothetical protein